MASAEAVTRVGTQCATPRDAQISADFPLPARRGHPRLVGFIPFAPLTWISKSVGERIAVAEPKSAGRRPARVIRVTFPFSITISDG